MPRRREAYQCCGHERGAGSHCADLCRPDETGAVAWRLVGKRKASGLAEGALQSRLPCRLRLRHLALAAAESLALTSGLLRQSSLAGLGVANVPLTFAHLDLPAALMAALPAALIRLLPFLAAFNLAERIFRALARALMSLRRCAAVMWYLRLPGVGASSADGIGISPPPPAAIESIWP